MSKEEIIKNGLKLRDLVNLESYQDQLVREIEKEQNRIFLEANKDLVTETGYYISQSRVIALIKKERDE